MQTASSIRALAASLVIPCAGLGCPTGEDLGAGVRIEYSNGWYEVHSRVNQHSIASVVYSDQGKVSDSRIISFGVFETEVTFVGEVSGDPEAVIHLSYSFDLSDYFPIAEGSSVSGQQFEVADSGERYTNRYRVEIGEAKSVLIGDCAYVGLPVVHSYGWWWERDQDVGVYMPELGIYLPFDTNDPSGLRLMRDASIDEVSR